MKVTLDLNLEKFRYSLVGDGYILEEVERLTEGQLIAIFESRVERYINAEYDKGYRLGLYDGRR